MCRLSANHNDRMRAWLERELEETPGALATVALDDIVRRYLGIDGDPTVDLQDRIAASGPWFGLGGDALYAFFEP